MPDIIFNLKNLSKEHNLALKNESPKYLLNKTCEILKDIINDNVLTIKLHTLFYLYSIHI